MRRATRVRLRTILPPRSLNPFLTPREPLAHAGQAFLSMERAFHEKGKTASTAMLSRPSSRSCSAFPATYEHISAAPNGTRRALRQVATDDRTGSARVVEIAVKSVAKIERQFYEDIVEVVSGEFSTTDSGLRARTQTGPRQTTVRGARHKANRCHWRCTAGFSSHRTESSAAFEPTSGRHSPASPRRSCRRSQGTKVARNGFRRTKVKSAVDERPP